MPVDQEAVEGFTKCFEEMANRLINFQMYTHISIGFKQSGQNCEYFEVLVLLAAMPLTIGLVATAQSNIDGQSRIFVGTVFDQQRVPVMVVLNQGQQNEVSMGTSKIVYDNQYSDEFKCFFFDNQVQDNQFLNGKQKEATVNVYCVDKAYENNFQYGHTQDYPFNQQWANCYFDLIPPQSKSLEMNHFQAMKEYNLKSILLKPQLSNSGLRERLMNKSNVNATSNINGQIQCAVQSVTNQLVEVKKTRAQILKEQKAQEVKNRQQMQQNQLSNGPAIPMGFQQPASGSACGSGMQTKLNFGIQPSFQTSSAGVSGTGFKVTGFQPPQQQQTQPFQQPTFKPIVTSQAPSAFNSQGPSMTQQPQTQTSGLNFGQQSSTAFRPLQQTTGFNPPGNSQQPQSSQPFQRFNTLQVQKPQQTQTFYSRGNFSFGMQNHFNSSFQQQQQQKNPVKFDFASKPLDQPQPLMQLQAKVQPAPQPAQPTQSKLKFTFQPMQQQPVMQPQAFTPQAPLQSQAFVPQQSQAFAPQQSQAFAPQLQQPLPPPQAPIVQAPPQFNFQPLPQVSFQPQPINAFCQPQFMPQQCSSQFQAKVFQKLQHLPFDSIKMKKYLDNIEQELFNQSPKTPQQLQNIQELEQLIENQPEKFILLVTQASSQLEKQEDFEQKFRDEVLFQQDLGLYLLRITEVIKRVDESLLQSYINQAQIIYSKHSGDPSVKQYLLQKILEKLILKQLPGRSEGFKKLYQEHKAASRDPRSREAERLDLKILVDGVKFICHQTVFRVGSEYFEKHIFERQDRRRYRNQDHLNFDMPHWMQPDSFKLYVRYLYLGSLDPQDVSFKVMFGLYKIAYCFRDYILEDHIVVQGLIPNMTSEQAIFYLIEIQKFVNDEQDHRESKILLKDYCIHILAKYLPKQLRTDRRKLQELNINVMSEIIQSSFSQLRGDEEGMNMDMDIIIKFAAELYAKSDTIRLLMIISKRYRKSMAFNSQTVRKFKEWMASTDPTQLYYCDFIQDDHIRKKAEEQKIAELEEVQENGIDKTFFLQPESSLSVDRFQEKHEELLHDFFEIQLDKNWVPKNNVVLDSQGYPKTQKNQKPCHQFVLKISEIRANKRSNGLTIISKAFSAARRSWHIKIDIDADDNFSWYLVERGIPLGPNSKGCNFFVPNFQTNIFEFQLKYKSVVDREKRSTIFYSFAHNSNQIIGHQNFFNIKNLRDSDQLEVTMYIKELMVHSALMNHISNNFQKLYNNSNRNDLMRIPFPMIYSLLASHNLRVDDENIVLSFVFNYDKALNLLSKCLRYNFLDFAKILSALRRNQNFSKSQEFLDRLKLEMFQRVSNQGEIQDLPRLYYEKIGKVEHANAQTIIEEVVKWAVTATRDAETRRPTPPPQERQTYERFAREIEQQSVVVQRRPIRHEPPRIKDIYATKEAQDTKQREIEYLKKQLEDKEKQLKQRPPALQVSKSLPRFLQTGGVNKENVEPNKDSFQSFKLNQTIQSPIRPPSEYKQTQLANRKIERAKVSADFSCLLKQLNTSPEARTESFRINPVAVPQNPMMRTRIPTVSNQQQSGGILQSIQNLFGQLK